MLVLVHSPLVGPMTWRGCVAAFERRGHRVAVPSLVGAFEQDGAGLYDRLAGRAAEAVRAARPDGPVVLVAHSGAGSLLPAIGESLDMPVAGAVFVDATLPHAGQSFLDTAPPVVAEQLASLARGGRLPTWDRWFPPAVIDALLPDAEVRAQFVAELPEIPLAYFEERAPKADAWGSVPCAYLRLSPPYDGPAAQAGHLGWPTTRVEADHLAMVTRPEAIAGQVAVLLEAIRYTPRR